MKKKLLPLILLPLILLLLIVGTGYYFFANKELLYLKPLTLPDTAQEKTHDVKYEIETALKDDTYDFDVYKFVNNDNIDEQVEKIKNIFDLKTDIIKDNAKKIRKLGKISPGQTRVMFSYNETSGYWSYNNLQETENRLIQKDVPSDEECKKIAIKFAKESLNLPQNYDNISISPETTGDTTTNDLNVIAKHVTFQANINKIPVYGIMRLKVVIGDKGKIVAVYKQYSDIFKYSKVKTISNKKAYEKVLSQDCSTNIRPEAKNAKIKKVQVCYWAEGSHIEEQTYLQPVWVFEGDATLESGEIQNFSAVVPAI